MAREERRRELLPYGSTISSPIIGRWNKSAAIERQD
jgi:hypothetical protein